MKLLVVHARANAARPIGQAGKHSLGLRISAQQISIAQAAKFLVHHVPRRVHAIQAAVLHFNLALRQLGEETLAIRNASHVSIARQDWCFVRTTPG